MTPVEFREKAKVQIQIAKALISLSPEQAWYNAGYAVEFMLKARLCIKRGWPRFPSDFSELKEWNKRDGFDTKERLFIHDLDELLKIAGIHPISLSSYNLIDWKMACEWSEHIRYMPNKSVSLQEAEAYVEQIEKVVDELCIFELLNSLVQMEATLSKKFGPFFCFALVQDVSENWVLLISWMLRNAIAHDADAALKKNLDEIDIDISSILKGVHTLSPADEVIQGLFALFSSFGGYVQHAPRTVFKDCYVHGYPLPPNGFYITLANWSEGQLKQAWDQIPCG